MIRLRLQSAIVYLSIFILLGVQVVSAASKTASPELINQLSNELSITPAQATGGAGALFKLAKSHLSPADFNKVAAVVPGMSHFLKAAPSTSNSFGFPGASSELSGNLGELASTASAFQKLGLSPEMAMKFIPILTSFVKSKGGASLASLLGGALKL